jgi:phosphoribosylaminoimidazole carboxylase
MSFTGEEEQHAGVRTGLSAAPVRVACIGGGQLGRMMALEAPRLNIQMRFLDPSPTCPASSVAPVTTGSLLDAAAIRQLVKDHQQPDVITAEIEHINCEVLKEFVGIAQPAASVIQLIQDKYNQKEHFARSGIPVPPFCACESTVQILEAAARLGLPIMLKARTGAYDGRGNAVLEASDDPAIHQALQKLGVPPGATSDLNLYAEGWVDFACELAVMVVRSSVPAVHKTRTYPAVNAIQQDSICRIVLAPVRNVSAEIRHRAEELARTAIDSLPTGASGVFGVEMFVTGKGDVLLNEVAPRPHNTGHYTQDACHCSQFENHLRAVCGLPLGSTHMKVEAAAMVNVLGSASDSMEESLQSSNAALHMDNAVVHWYGKEGCRLGRKMGHINLTANSHAELDAALKQLMRMEGIPEELLPSTKPPSLVGVVMGSQSDLPTMQAAVDVLKEFKIPHEVDIVSAHRTPDKLMQYSRQAAGRGLRVLIAGAGGAAHLPGMMASLTPLPVIGVPVKTSTLSGVDSLYSIVQMPRGVPVATVAIGNATNAGLLAVRILSTSRPELREKMMQYRTEMKEMVDEMSAKLLDLGSDEFLQQMDNKNHSVNV